MRRRALVATLAAVVLVVAACSDGGTTDAGPGEVAASGGDDPVIEAPEELDEPPVFVQHALTGTVEVDDGEPVAVIRGVDPIVVYLGAADASTLTIEDFHAEWDELSSQDENPQAAFVFGDPEHEPALVSLREPTWNATTRTVTYGIGIPSERDPRLDGIAPTGATLPDEFELVTLYITWPGDDTVPAPTTTTTSTTTTSTTSTTLPSAATTSPATVPQPTAPPTAPEPPPTAPTTTALPSGPPRIVASPETVVLPSSGGSSTFTLRNVGSGAGSWTVQSIASQGIAASPTSGILLPNGATTVTVSYNGHGPADDFIDELKVFTSSGTIFIRIVVAG